MSQARVGKWGKNLAVRLPQQVATTTGIQEGETVVIEAHDGDIVIRRVAAQANARRLAVEAAAEIIAESRNYSLGDVSVRDLLDDGRRE